MPIRSSCASGAAHGSNHRGSRKYRVSPEQLPQALQGIVARLDELGGDADIDELARQDKAAQELYLALPEKLRCGHANRPQQNSRGKLRWRWQPWAMPRAAVSPCADAAAGGNAHGLEAVEFQVAANPGAPLRAWAKVASGGELSRIILAIQVAASQAATVPKNPMIFDESDSGIGGRVAEIVGRRLLKAAGYTLQVMCVTHLPQVAAMADAQWQVSKAATDGVTLSHIRVLKPAERIEEIARMLGGVKITETTLKHAAKCSECLRRAQSLLRRMEMTGAMRFYVPLLRYHAACSV